MPIDTSFLVNDKWRIQSKIGSGATGVVYSARDVDSDETVAVKLEHRDELLLKNERDTYERLGCFRESCRAFGLPFIHFYGKYSPNHDALVMDCLGPPLEEEMQSDQKIDEELFSRTALKALDILQYVHSQGVVHGDVTGGNLVRGLEDEDALYLVDFGLSRTGESRSVFEASRINDLHDLGTALLELRTGLKHKEELEFYDSGAPEIERYFEMLKSKQLRNSVDYTSLKEMFEGFLLEHRTRSLGVEGLLLLGRQ